MEREQWLSEAESCERAEARRTAYTIVRATIGIGVEEDDRKRIWIDDAEQCVKRGSIEVSLFCCVH